MPVPLRDLKIINSFVVFKWVLLGFPKLILQISSMLKCKIVEFLILIAEINLGHFKANFSSENLIFGFPEFILQFSSLIKCKIVEFLILMAEINLRLK